MPNPLHPERRLLKKLIRSRAPLSGDPLRASKVLVCASDSSDEPIRSLLHDAGLDQSSPEILRFSFESSILPAFSTFFSLGSNQRWLNRRNVRLKPYDLGLSIFEPIVRVLSHSEALSAIAR